MIKTQIFNVLKKKRFARFFLIMALKLHNRSYQMAGMLSPGLEPDGLHPKHRLMQYHDWFASKLEKQWDILDIGCGNGALTYDMKSWCRTVTGIDINKDNIDKAKESHLKKGIDYICADALEYEFKTGFHAIVLSNVLEHIDRRVDFLKKIYANQDKKNPPVLFLRVPMITRDWITLYKREKGVEWRLDYTHFTEYTLDQVFDEMNQAGLMVENYEVQFGEFYGVVKKMNEKK